MKFFLYILFLASNLTHLSDNHLFTIPITEWLCPTCFHDNPPKIPQCEVCGRNY